MNFTDEIYVGESVKDLSTVMYSLKRNIPVFNLYVIAYDKNSKNMAEIMESREAVKKRNESRNLTVMGIAYSRREAYDLFKYIIEDFCANDWNIDTFKERFEEGSNVKK